MAPGSKSNRGGLASAAWTRLAVVVVALALVAAACGGDDTPTDAAGDGDGDGTTTDAEELSDEVAAAQAEAEELGLQFATSHELIVERAMEEDHLEVIWALAPDDFLDDAVAKFTELYPWLEGNVTVHALDGVEARQRFLLEAQAGALGDYGVGYLSNEVYADTEELCDWDIYGMAEAGILDIPLEMIDPVNRTVVAAGNSSSVFVYNIEAFESAGVPLPETWDDLLDPEIYGPDGPIRTVGDVRLATFSALVPAWGLDRAVEWYRTFAEEIQPTWSQRFGPMIQQIQAGEFHAQPFVNTHNAYDLMEGRPDRLEAPHTVGDRMGILFLEPVPIRITDTHCALNDDISSTPYSSLLFLEWLASDDGQLAYENPEGAPYQGSIHTELEGGLADLVEDLELSVVQWEDIEEQSDWIDAIIEAAGFPQAQE